MGVWGKRRQEMAALTRGPVTPRSRASEELRRCFDAIGVNQKGDSRPRLPLESGLPGRVAAECARAMESWLVGSLSCHLDAAQVWPVSEAMYPGGVDSVMS
jgi:hypothetical protein